MDFELPDDWMGKPDVFPLKPYDDKVAMILTLMQPMTVDIVSWEINR